MNNSSPEYDDTPRQDIRRLSDPQDSDNSREEFGQRDLISIQNRLFYQAANGNQPENQRQR